MKKLIYILIALLILAIVSFIIINNNFTGVSGQTVSDVYTYTKALCNESNFCQDYIITCEGNKTLTINPISGAFTQNSQDWQDPRNNSEGLCN